MRISELEEIKQCLIKMQELADRRNQEMRNLITGMTLTLWVLLGIIIGISL